MSQLNFSCRCYWVGLDFNLRGTDSFFLRGDFLKNRVFLAKSAQNLVTKPAGENPLTAIIFSNKFSKICENLKNFTGSLAT